MFRIQTLLLAVAVSITACGHTKVPSTAIQPIGTAPTTETLIKPKGLWVLTPNHEPHSYHSISYTTIHELSNPAIHETSTEATTAFTISLDQAHSSLNISGHIDSVRVRSRDQLESSENAFTLPLLFEGELAHSTLTISVRSSQLANRLCSPFLSSILSELHTAILVFPMHLTPGLTWRDSTLVTTCTPGGTPITRKTTQSFTVIGEIPFDTTTALLLKRIDSTYIRGDGAEANHQIHLEGTGIGTANIYLSPIIARMLGIELSEKIEIAVINSGKTRRFIQEVRQSLKATN